MLVLDEGALADYPGAIVLVTHDDVFAARCTTRTMYVQGGAVSLAQGGRVTEDPAGSAVLRNTGSPVSLP